MFAPRLLRSLRSTVGVLPAPRLGGLARIACAATILLRVSPANALPPVAEIHVVDHSGANPSISGMAPFTVHVDALESVLGAGSPLTARYQWNFGDTTSTSRFNTLDGWVGAHLYEAPGVYTLTLTVTNEDGESDRRQLSVEVTADTRRRIHVANGGDDANDGQTPQTAVRTVAAAQSLLGSNTAVLFRRGEIHDFASAQLTLEGVENVVVGAYGEGERPILLGPAYDPSVERTLLEIINPYPGAGATGPANRNIVIRDLSWRTPTPSSPAVEFNHVATQVHGRDNYNLTWVGNHFDDVGSCVQTSSGNWPQNLDRALGSGLLLLDNVHEESTRYFTYFATSHTTLLGNRSILGSHTSFIFRLYADRVLIAHNDFQQPAGDREEYAIAGGPHCNVETGQLLADCEPAHGNQQWGEYAYLAHNRLDGTLRLGYEDRDSYYRWIVLDSNRFTRAAANQSPTPTLRHFPHTRNVMLRNNIFEGPGGTSAFSTTGVEDITFAHNTGLSPNNGNTFVEFFPATAPPAGAYTFVHNLWLSPVYEPGAFGSFPYTVRVENSDLVGMSFDGNLWPATRVGTGGEMWVGGEISGATWQGLPQVDGDLFHGMDLSDVTSDFTPRSGTPPVGAAGPVPGVFVDVHGRPRPVANGTIGAVEVHADAIFSDDFETGDLDAWSLVVH